MTEQPFYQQQTPPQNYLVFAILTTIFCCLVPGIVSIVYAAQVNSKWVAGDIEGANHSSRNAKLWAWISFGCGLIATVFFAILAALGVFAGLLFGN